MWSEILADGRNADAQADSWGPVSQGEKPATSVVSETATNTQKRHQQQEQPVEQSAEVIMEEDPEWSAEEGGLAESAPRAAQAALQEVAPQAGSSRPSGASISKWLLEIVHTNTFTIEHLRHGLVHDLVCSCLLSFSLVLHVKVCRPERCDLPQYNIEDNSPYTA